MDRRAMYFFGLLASLALMAAGYFLPMQPGFFSSMPAPGGTGLAVAVSASPRLLLIFFGMLVAVASTLAFVRQTLQEHTSTAKAARQKKQAL